MRLLQTSKLRLKLESGDTHYIGPSSTSLMKFFQTYNRPLYNHCLLPLVLQTFIFFLLLLYLVYIIIIFIVFIVFVVLQCHSSSIVYDAMYIMYTITMSYQIVASSRIPRPPSPPLSWACTCNLAQSACAINMTISRAWGSRDSHFFLNLTTPCPRKYIG